MPTPFFADLVRELCQGGGTGPLTPTGAVPGHRRFADAVPGGAAFHYSIAGIARPDQWEVGLGRIVDGKLVRDTVSASSNGGAAVDFAIGLKTLALTVGASWFSGQDGALAALDARALALTAAVAERQPLSTSHPGAALAAADDLVTLRRGAGWVNVPAAALAFRDAAGRYDLGGVLAAPSGGAAAPSISFSSDVDTGLFRPGADSIGFATGGSERARLDANGRLGIGVTGPAYPMDVQGGAGIIARIKASASANLGLTLGGDANGGWIGNGAQQALEGLYFQNGLGLRIYTGSAEQARITTAGLAGFGTVSPSVRVHAKSSGEILRVETATARGSGDAFIGINDPSGRKGYVGYGGANDKLEIVNSLNADLLFGTNNAYRWQILGAGDLTPAADNAYNFGGASNRAKTLFAVTGTINTSDAREKAWRGAPTLAELAAARRIIAELGFYRWNDAIAEKGAGEARLHFGPRAQAVWAIMADEGLIDPLTDGAAPDSRYAFLCHDAWATDAETGIVAGSRFGVRTDQLALFLIAAQEARIAALEAAA